MEEDKKIIKRQNLEITILSIIIVALLGLCIYMLFIKKDDKPVDNNGGNNQAINNNTNENNQTNNNTNQNDETDNFKPWMKYILEQNITKIEVSKVSCDEDNFESKTVVINTSQLKEIFKKFMNYKLQVDYAGGGGWSCGEELNIKYQKNGKEYELGYLGSEGDIIPSSDGCVTIYDKDLENALYNSADIKNNEEEKGQDGMCVMYKLITMDYLLDEYFK